MQQQEAVHPTEQTQISALKNLIQAFIGQHEHGGKGKDRKDVISSLKDVIHTDYQTLSAAYDGIFSAIQVFTDKQYKKTPKVVNYLQAFLKEIAMHRELEQARREGEEKLKAEENKRREIEETLDKERKETVARRPKQKKVSVVPAEAPGSTEKEKTLKAEAAQLRQERDAERQAKQAAAEKAEKRLAHEKRKAERLQKAKEEAEAVAKKAAEELKAKERAPQPTGNDMQKLLDKAEEARLAALQDATNEKKLRSEAEKRAADEQKLREETTQRAAALVREAIAKANREADEKVEQERKKVGEELGHTLQATKSKFADLLADVDKARAEGEEKYQKGRQEGKAEGKMEGSLEMCVYLDQVVGNDRNLRKQLQSKARQLEGPKSVLLLQYMSSDNHDEESIETPPRTQASSTQKLTAVKTKQEMIEILITLREKLLTNTDTASAITRASIEYVTHKLQLRCDLSILDILNEAEAFFGAISIGDCSFIKRDYEFRDVIAVPAKVLTEEGAKATSAFLRKNALGYIKPEVATVFELYVKEQFLVSNAEKRLKKIFIRDIGQFRVKEWLGSKYDIVYSLLAYAKSFAKNSKEYQDIKVALFMFVAHKNDKTSQEIQADINKLELSPKLLQFIGSKIDLNETIKERKPLTETEFLIFAALFNNAEFFGIEDNRPTYDYFEKLGLGKCNEASTVELLSKVQPKQQAPSGSSATFKPAPATKTQDNKVTTGPAANPLHTIAANTGGPSIGSGQ